MIGEITGRSILAECLSESSVKEAQLLPLMEAADLDAFREPERRIGTGDLLSALCRHGRSHWLDPWTPMKPIRDILTKYLGPPDTLRPVIALLKKSAELGLSPHALVTYTILPRLHSDPNWRTWSVDHYPAFRSILEIVRELRQKATFQQDVISVSGRKVLTDVFLFKYVAYPLSGLDLDTLGNPDFTDAVIGVWSRIQLTQYGMLLYLRSTVLPALRLLLRLPDSVGLIRLIEHLPEFEEALNAAVTREGPLADLDLSLYGKVPSDGLYLRQGKRYRPIDYYREYLAYQELCLTTLKRTGGLEATQWLASTARRRMSVKDVEDLLRMVNALLDYGSRHIYTWHAHRLLERTSQQRDSFVGAIRANGGVHPTYPHLDELFRPRSVERERLEIAAFAEELGLKDGAYVGHRQLLDALISRYPAVGGPLRTFRTEVIDGLDRNWTQEKTLRFDHIIDAVTDDPEYDRRATMHALLLRSVIRGLGKLFSTGVHSMSFAALLSQYKVEPPEPEIRIDLRFDLPLHRMDDLSDLQSTELHRRVHLSAVQKHWGVVRKALTDRDISLGQAMGAFFRKKGDQLTKRREQSGVGHKSVRRLESQYNQLGELLEHYPEWDTATQTVAGLVAAAYFGNKAGEIPAAAVSAVVGIAGSDPTTRGRIDYLLEDIVDGTPTLRQLSFLITFLEDIIDAFLEIPDVTAALGNEELRQLVTPYIKTRRSVLDRDAVEAAWRATVQLGALQSERSNWQQVAAETTVLGDRFVHAHRIYVSRTPLDSYYGDMGGICLSGMPEHITDPNFFNLRLVDMEDEEIVGMGLIYRYRHPIRGFRERDVWLAIAFNPLYSLLQHLSHNQQLYLYLQYRRILETLARNTSRSVLIPGVFTEGVISNHGGFARVILAYERAASAPLVTGIRSFDLYYSAEAYASALHIIDPSREGTFHAEANLDALSEKLFG